MHKTCKQQKYSKPQQIFSLETCSKQETLR